MIYAVYTVVVCVVHVVRDESVLCDLMDVVALASTVRYGMMGVDATSRTGV